MEENKNKEQAAIIILFMVVIMMIFGIRNEPRAEIDPDAKFWMENEIALRDMRTYMEEHPEEFMDESQFISGNEKNNIIVIKNIIKSKSKKPVNSSCTYYQCK